MASPPTTTVTTVTTALRGISGTEALLQAPSGLAVGRDGTVFIGDAGSNRIYRVDSDGKIITFAGTTAGVSGDGGPAESAQLRSPSGLAVGADGSIYVADTGNHRIRRIDPRGQITTIAGTGPTGPDGGGFSGDGGPARDALLFYPAAVAISADGALYVSDGENRRIRRMDMSGTINTIAGSGPSGPSGNGGFSGDGGPATKARMTIPGGLAVAPDGVVLFADPQNNRVRRIDRDGTIGTFAGFGGTSSTPDPEPTYVIGGGFSGDGGPANQARFTLPTDVVIGNDGTAYIIDSGNFRVRRVGRDGIVSTLAGLGLGPYERNIAASDGRPASVFINHPSNVAVGATGVVYFKETALNVKDTQENKIRRLAPTGAFSLLAGGGSAVVP